MRIDGRMLLIAALVMMAGLAVVCTEASDDADADIKTGSCGANATYTYDSSDGSLTIEGTGAMTYYSCGGAPWYNYGTYIYSVTIGSGITSIGDYAFYHCTSITSVTLSSSITSIGHEAFRYCTSLTSVTMTNVSSIGYHVFSGCTSLTSVTMPNVSSIGNYAFSGCTSLTSVTMPNVTSIGDYAFYGCKSLASVTIPSGVLSISDGAFSGCTSLTSVTIPSGVTSLGWYAFYGCTSLTSVTIPSSVTSINGAAFSYCTSLNGFSGDSPYIVDRIMLIEDSNVISCAAGSDVSSAIIPSGVASISKNAFSGCTSLTSVTIPSSVTSIGNYAFQSCYRLAEVINNSGLNIVKGSDTFGYVAYYAVEVYKNTDTHQFQYTDGNGNTFTFMRDSEGGYHLVSEKGCSGSITLPMNFTHGSETVTGYKIVGAFSGCTSLTSVTISSGVTSIGNWAFFDCTSLTSVTIPSSVISIGEGAFYSCTSLTSVDMPSVTSISKNAFSGCTSLTSLTIPLGVTSIGSQAFYRCTSLTSVTIPPGVTSIGYEAFYRCETITSITIGDGVSGINSTAFGGWKFYDTDGKTEITSVSSLPGYTYAGSMTKMVRQSSSNHSVTYDAVGGSVSAPTQDPVAEGGTFTVASYSGTKSSCYFNGWNDGTKTYKPGETYTMGSSDVTFTADWIQYDGKCGDDLYYNIDGSTLNIFGSGHMYDYTNGSPAPWDGVKTSIESVAMSEGATSIGSYAFRGCTSLTTVTIPSGVTYIGSYAFRGCTSLTTVTMPNVTTIGVGAFRECASLTSVTMPSVTSISYEAFYQCTALTSVTIPSGVTSLSSAAFNDCIALTSVTMPNVTSIGSSVFCGCTSLTSVTMPNVTSIGDNSFRGCTSLTSVDMPCVVSIGNSAFYNCTSLESATMSSATSIGDNAFYYCTSMTSVTMSNVTSVGYMAFYNCISLTSVDMPCVVSIGNSAFYNCTSLESATMSNVTTIDSYAFSGCTSLTTVTMSNVTSVGYVAFYNCISLTSVDMPCVVSIGNSAFSRCTSLESATMPSVTSISYEAFYQCTSLTTVTMSSATSIGVGAFNNCTSLESATMPSVTSIGNSAFSGCTSLTSVTMPSVTSIGNYVFSGCTSLTSVNIPSGVTSIGNYVFSGCTSLESVTMPCVTSIGSSAFSGCTSLTSVTMPSVTSIGDYAFLQCTSLPSLTIPSGVTSIGSDAFAKCTSLTSVTMPSGVKSIGGYAFYNCTSLTSVTIPSSVTSIGTYAFTGFSKITSITIAEGVSGIHSDAFYGWKFYDIDGTTQITSVSSLPGYTYVGTMTKMVRQSSSDHSVTYDAAGGSVSAPTQGPVAEGESFSIASYSGIKSGYNFIGWDDGESLYFPGEEYVMGSSDVVLTALWIDTAHSGTCGDDAKWYMQDGTLTVYGSGDMYDYEWSSAGPSSYPTEWTAPWSDIASDIGSVAILDGIASVGKNTFTSCLNLQSLDLGEDIVCIGSNSFAFTAVTSVAIPSGVLSIDSAAFDCCGSLSTVTIPSNVTTIRELAFQSCTSLNGFEGDSPFIRDGVMLVKDGTVIGCAAGPEVTSVVIPSDVTSVGGYAFEGCGSLVSLTMHDGVTAVGDSAFLRCMSLASVSMPGIETIGSNAFFLCTALGSVTIPSGIGSIGTGAFSECRSLTSITFADASDVSIGEGAFAIGSSMYPVTCHVYGCSEGFLDDYGNEYTTFVYDSAKHSVTYDVSGGSTSAPVQAPLSKGESFIVASYSGKKTGHNFIGWDDGESVYYPGDGYVMGSSDVVLTALWVDTAHSGTCGDDAKWYFINGTLTVYGSGDMYDYQWSGAGTYANDWTAPWSAIAQSIDMIKVCDGITGIGKKSFTCCRSLQHLELESDVASIGEYAFNRCSSLSSISMPVVTFLGESAFGLCDSLVSVSMPTVISLGESAFEMCPSLESVTIPSSIEYIGINPFSECKSLGGFSGDSPYIVDGVMLIKNGNLISYAAGTDATAISVPAICTAVGTDAFRGCDSLVSVSMPSVTSIGSTAFYLCTSLVSVEMPSVTYIGGSAFNHCTSLVSVEMPSAVQVCDLAFIYCKALVSVTVPSSLTFIGENPFVGCTSLEVFSGDSSYIVDGVMLIKQGRLISYAPGTKAVSISLPSSVTSLAVSAFRSFTTLTSISMPTVTYIGNYAFSYCDSLSNIIAPNVTYIGNSAFTWCTSITSMTIPSDVSYIGNHAFYGCRNIESVTICEGVSGIDPNAFLGWEFYKAGGKTKITSVDSLPGYTYAGTMTKMVRQANMSFKVTYDADGGSESAPVQDPLAEGETFVIQSYSGTKEGYGFAGWNDGTETYKAGSEYVMGGYDVTFKAVWVPNDTLCIECSDTVWYGNGDARITLSVTSNPGISSVLLKVSYDDSVMTLKDAESSGLMDLTPVNVSRNPFTVYLETSELGEDTSSAGILVTLVFVVDKDAENGTYPVTITAVESLRDDLTEVPVSVEDGSLIIRAIPGDLNGDGKVSSADSLLLRKHLANWSVTIVGNPDVNGDGKVTLADSLLLRMYIADWDVILH